MAAKNFDYTAKEHSQGPKHRTPVGANEQPVVSSDLMRGFSYGSRGYGTAKKPGKPFLPSGYDQYGGS